MGIAKPAGGLPGIVRCRVSYCDLIWPSFYAMPCLEKWESLSIGSRRWNHSLSMRSRLLAPWGSNVPVMSMTR